MQTVCLLLLATVAVGAALHFLRDVMIPFALASFLAIALSPVVDLLAAKTRLSRPISVGITMVLGALLLAILGGVVTSSIAQYDQTSFGREGSAENAGQVARDVLVRLRLQQFESFVEPLGKKLEATVPQLVGILGAVLSQGVTVLIFLMFLLIEQRRPAAGPRPSVGDTVRERVKKYISVKTVTSAVTGILVGLVLWIVGAPAPVLFGLLSFLLNFIPTIGSIIAVALPLPLLLADDAPLGTIVMALALPGAIQFVVGQIWENKLLGDAFDLRASVVLLALVFWGKIWGIVGMLLATPITAVLKTLMEEWDMTSPLARAMGQDANLPEARDQVMASADADSSP